MIESAREFFCGGAFMPHGHCYFWNPGITFLHVASDALIFLAYTTIPVTLLYMVRKRKDIPFDWMFLCFGTFIVACGTTHLMEIWNLWHSAYWLSGIIKAVTAAASIGTAALLIRLVPTVRALPSLDVIRRSEEKLRAQAAELSAANKELEAFCYSVSHDLRAPLRSIDGFSQTLLDDEGASLSDGGRDALRRVRSATQRMGQLIDDMLSLSRVTRQELVRAPVDLSGMACEVLEELRVATSGRLVIPVVHEGMAAEGDRTLLRVVMTNLIGNAWKFTSKTKGARIEVGARRDAEGTVFFVKDNGAGFDMEYVNKLFGAFQRLHAASDFPGTGVGLATVHRIIHRHGGRVWAEGVEGKGATFFFTLPSSSADKIV